MDLFGEVIDDEEADISPLKHPLTVLREAIEDVSSLNKDWMERDEAEAAKTPEDIERENAKREKILQLLEEQGMLTVNLPDTEEQGDEILVQSGDHSFEVKGTLQLPCFCKKGQITVYNGARGKFAMKCPECGNYVLIDFDDMTAKPLELHGSIRRIKKQDDQH